MLALAAALGLAVASAAGAAAPCYEEGPDALPAPPVKSETLNGRPTLRHVPPHPKGIVYLFHGTGGSETFATRLESRRVLAALTAAGYGYAAAPSLDRTQTKRWDISSLDPAANPDVAYMLGLHRALIASGEITAATPVFAMGMSNGGAFANVFAAAAKAQGLPVVAVADYMGPFTASLRGVDPKAFPPTLLILSQNDGLVDAARVQQVAQRLTAQGARIEVHLNAEHSVCPATFGAIPGLSAADRETLAHKTLPDLGLIDADGARRVYLNDPVITRDDMLDAVSKAPPGPNGRLIVNQLFIAWGAHEMRSDYAARQVAFFDTALQGAR